MDDDDNGDLALLHSQLVVETGVEMRLLSFYFQIWHFAARRRLLRNLPYEIFKVKKSVCQVVQIHIRVIPGVDIDIGVYQCCLDRRQTTGFNPNWVWGSCPNVYCFKYSNVLWLGCLLIL